MITALWRPGFLSGRGPWEQPSGCISEHRIRGPVARHSCYCTRAVLIAALALAQPAIVGAQAPMALSGVVTDTVGTPILGVVITATGTAATVITDERGEFRLPGMVPGPVELRARRLGFAPLVREHEVTADDAHNRLQLTMTPLPTTLRPVVVQRSRGDAGGARLAGYYERLERRSGGHFITRPELESQEHRRLSQVLANTPGVSSFQLRGGGVVRMRGRSCRPLVWIDGVPMPAGEVDLDAFPVNTLHGVELYLGAAAPMAHTALRDRSSCGTILLWSRGRDTDPPRAARRTVDLEQLVASAAAHTADQVDRPAGLNPAEPIEVTYPPDMFAARIGGSVVVEFVVDGHGRIEPRTIGLVSSTHALFAAAVMDGLGRAVHGSPYTPALKGDRAVRQVVQQSFGFSPGSGRVTAK